MNVPTLLLAEDPEWEQQAAGVRLPGPVSPQAGTERLAERARDYILAMLHQDRGPQLPA